VRQDEKARNRQAAELGRLYMDMVSGMVWMLDRRRDRQSGGLPRWVGYVVILAAELALTAALRLLAPVFPITAFPIPYVVLLMAVAYTLGLGPAIAAFVVGSICFVYFLPPYHGIWPLAVTERDWAGIVALLLGSGIVGSASYSMRRSRNRAEALAEQLSRTNARTTETLETIAECFFALDSELRFLDVNRVAEQTVFMRPANELLGQSLIELYPQLAGSEFVARCREVFSSHHEAHSEDCLWLPDRWFECHLFPYGDCLEVYMREVTDRRHAEEALRQSEGKYRSLIETMNEGFCVTDADYVFTYVNPRFAEMIGYPQAEIVGHRLHGFLDEPSRAVLDVQIPERRAGRYAQYEIVWVASDGHPVRTLISPRPVIGSDGVFAGAFAAVTDITELKRSETALRESEHRYRELFHNANDAILLLEVSDAHPPGRFIDVNDVACQRLGYTREELLTMGPADIDSPESAREAPKVMKEIREQGHATFEAVQVAKSGLRVPVEISAHLFHLGDREVVMAIARDITERKLAEDTLRRSEERFRNLFDRAADCLFLHDLEGRFVEVNRATGIYP
jgi:PAS domain S-box-containing protein